MAQNCGRSFMRKSDLSIHIQMYDKDTWQCTECDWTTTYKKYPQAHLIGHEEDLHYKCDQCNKKCKFREQLRRHKKKNIKRQNNVLTVLNGITENGKWSNIVGIWRNDYKLTAHQIT